MHRLLIGCGTAVLLAGTTLAAVGAEPATGVRWAGQPPASAPLPAPEGSLLNPNFEFWGDVTYAGGKLAFDGAEVPANGRFTKWLGGAKGGTLTVTFPQPYQVSEVSLHLMGEGAVTLETAAGTAEPPVWEKVIERATAADVPLDAKGEYWARLKPGKATTSARWRVTLGAGVSVMDAALWGTGPAGAVTPVGGEVRKKFPVAFESLPGADATAFSDHVYWSWQRPLLEDPRFKDQGAVWAQHDKWARLGASAILPPHETLNQPVSVVMAANEFEGALLTLTSLKDQVGKPIHDSGIYKEFQPGAQELRLKLGPVQGPTPEKVKLTLRVAGTMRTQLWGVVPGPLFAADNKPGAAAMLKYFTNGKTIADFPLVALPPCGSQVFWLEAQTDGAAPGRYTTTLAAEPGAAIPVNIEVLPVTLPTPRVWVHGWSEGAVGTTWPFTDPRTMTATVKDKLSRGMTSFGIPRGEGPVPADSEAAEARRQSTDVTFHYPYLIPDAWVGAGYGSTTASFENLTDAQKKQVADHVHAAVKRMKDFGLDYKDWYGELWDEPGDKNAELIYRSASWIKAADPKAQVYVNPAFPEKLESFKRMSELADAFVPFWSNWFKGPEWLAEVKPGRVNAFYAVQGSNRSELHEELVGHYRLMPWHAFKLGLNGWGFYAYYGPREDPYTDYDPAGSETDYQAVYPGPHGPVPSRQAEAYRDGWEDYRLLTLLSASGTPEAKRAIDEAFKLIPMGREPLTATGRTKPVDFEAIRLSLLRAAAQLPPAAAPK